MEMKAKQDALFEKNQADQEARRIQESQELAARGQALLAKASADGKASADAANTILAQPRVSSPPPMAPTPMVQHMPLGGMGLGPGPIVPPLPFQHFAPPLGPPPGPLLGPGLITSPRLHPVEDMVARASLSRLHAAVRGASLPRSDEENVTKKEDAKVPDEELK